MAAMNTLELEWEIAKFLNPRINIIVPNVFWGLDFQYELDLLCVTQAGWGTEVELKVSAGDIKADLTKRHKHDSNRIRRFFYGVPDYLADCEYLPKDAGLIVVDSKKCFNQNRRVQILRAPKFNRLARKFTDAEIQKLLALGCMRIWGLKESIYNRCFRHKDK